MLISIALLGITAYNQYQKLEYAKETILIQDKAIEKQQELINHQIRYISYFESQQSNHTDSPIYRGPL